MPETNLSSEEPHHVALPKLYGAPAYARPVVVVARTDRPFDPDELPLVVAMTDEERTRLDASIQGMAGTQVAQGKSADPAGASAPQLIGRPFTVRGLSDRIRGSRG